MFFSPFGVYGGKRRRIAKTNLAKEKEEEEKEKVNESAGVALTPTQRGRAGSPAVYSTYFFFLKKRLDDVFGKTEEEEEGRNFPFLPPVFTITAGKGGGREGGRGRGGIKSSLPL